MRGMRCVPLRGSRWVFENKCLQRSLQHGIEQDNRKGGLPPPQCERHSSSGKPPFLTCDYSMKRPFGLRRGQMAHARMRTFNLHHTSVRLRCEGAESGVNITRNPISLDIKRFSPTRKGRARITEVSKHGRRTIQL